MYPQLCTEEKTISLTSFSTPRPLWHMLQISDVLDLELAAALADSADVLGWEPKRSLAPAFTRPGQESERKSREPHLRLRELPLLRGFARFPVNLVARVGRSVVERLLEQTANPAATPLICTVPYFAAVAERWPGPVVYWLTDLIAEYSSADRAAVLKLDRRMCAAATLLCPNSRRLENYLVSHAGADPGKVCILPNATRKANLYPASPLGLGPRPAAIASIPGPIAGVIGNLAANMDWLLLEQLVDRTPDFSWVFVGPTTMEIPDREQRKARAAMLKHERTYFLGRQAYGDLAGFARAFDVAVLPYLRCEPTYSGSSTRFYEHLAACRPMIATRGFEELTRKEPLLKLIDTAEEAAAELAGLAACNYDDGLIPTRWRSSLEGTWEGRAKVMQNALADRLTATSIPGERGR